MQMPKIQKLYIGILVFLLVVVTSTIPAEARRSDTEREVLARVVQELALLDEIVSDAERRADPQARLYLDYPALHAELIEVRLGIEEYIEGNRLQPREIAPLSTDYSRLNEEE